MGVSIHSLVRRIPMALGPVIGGVLIGAYGRTTGVRYAFVAALILGLIALVVQQVMVQDKKSGAEAQSNPLKLYSLMTPDLRNLLISDILIRYAEQIPYAFAVIWAMDVNGLSALQFGVLTTVEMVTAMLVYIPIAYLADRNTKKPFVAITFVFFTIFPLVLLISRSFEMMIVAFIIRGLKEFGEPTRKALIMDLAPEGKKAGMFGLYYLMRDVIVSIAAFGGALLWNISPAVNFITAAVFGLAGTIYFISFGKDLDSRVKKEA